MKFLSIEVLFAILLLTLDVRGENVRKGSNVDRALKGVTKKLKKTRT